MTARQRGTALAETAMVVGLAMMIIFNGIELAMLGFYQLHADATAFAAARYAAAGGDPASFPGANFPPAFPPAISFPLTGTAQAVVTKDDAASLVLIPGVGTAGVQGQHQENVALTTTAGIPRLLISESLQQLVNYYPSGTQIGSAPSVHAICLAHSINTSGGNGTNGAFKIWGDHSAILQHASQEFQGGSWSQLTLQPAWQRGNPRYSQYQSTIDGWDTPTCGGT